MPKQEEINMAEDLPAPKSRKEEYLATAAGMTGIELPEPASREEIYLDAIAQGGGGGGLRRACRRGLYQILRPPLPPHRRRAMVWLLAAGYPLQGRSGRGHRLL